MVQRGRLYPFRDRRQAGTIFPAEAPVELSTFPVLPETLLYIELCDGHRAVPLDELTGVILRDPGAVIRILRTAVLEVESAAEGGLRLEECIAALGVTGCVAALKNDETILAGVRPEVRKAWTHAREIAESCASVAAERASEINPLDAYFVGLYHELEALPALLGWSAESAQVHGAALASFCALPQCVRSYFIEQRSATQWTPWGDLVRSAHHGVSSPPSAAVFA